MNNKMSNDILFNIIFGNSGSGGGGDNPFVPPTGYKQVGVVEGYPVPRINLRSACVNDLGFPFALGIDDDTVQAGDKILVVGQATDDNTPFAVWGTVDSTRTAGNYFIARLTVEGSAIRTDAAYVVDITANGGTLVFGATKVNVNVPNPSSGSIEITENGTYNVTDKASAVVNVENSYTASDEGKVVSSGALVGQTTQNITANGTYDTTTKNEVVVNVENSYTASDEGKVVDNGALVSQTSQNIGSNGTYDTTTKSEVVVNVKSYEKWVALHNRNTTNGSVILTDDDIPDGMTTITIPLNNSNAFGGINSSKITSIEANTFQNCRYMTEIVLPNVTSVGNNGLSMGNYRSTISQFDLSSVVTLGLSALANLKFANGTVLSLPRCTTIGRQTFYGIAGVSKIILPVVTAITQQAFCYAEDLVGVDVPRATSIAANAFADASALGWVHIGGTAGSLVTLANTSAFQNCDALEHIYVPDDLVEDYKVATNWSTYAAKITPESEMPTT